MVSGELVEIPQNIKLKILPQSVQNRKKLITQSLKDKQ